MDACSITEKVGPVWLVTQEGAKTQVANVPRSCAKDRAACWACSCRRTTRPITTSISRIPSLATCRGVEPRARARATDRSARARPSLDGLQVLWHEMPKGRGGQFGAQIAFSPDGQYLFLTVGDRQRMTPAQDPNTEAGQDPAPDARRQARAGESDGWKDRRGERFRSSIRRATPKRPRWRPW